MDSEPALFPDEAPAPYRVLARKYRPTTFDELIGQAALVRTLTNAIVSRRIAQAYMLAGVRGVGKTTTARIIARALNCIGPDGSGGPTAAPCGVCVHCDGIARDRHLDVIEMDAATHTTKEEIRELLDGVPFLPTSARFKVYIIDEIHMLSEKAFNALLKTLEEPPPHVKFIFATTEVRKVPVTVLSRCQRFDLRRVDAATLEEHLSRVAATESISIERPALALIARVADGSVRDGLSLLDRAIAHAGAAVDEVGVRDMLGLADRGIVFDLLEAALGGDAALALRLLAEQHQAGAEPAAVIEDLLELTHWLTRIKVAPECAEAPGVPEAERTRGRDLAQRLAMAEVTRAWQMLLKGLSEARLAPSPVQAAEMVLIRLAYAARLPTPAEALQGLAKPQPGPRPVAQAGTVSGAAAGRMSAQPPLSPVQPAPAQPPAPTTQPSSRLAEAVLPRQVPPQPLEIPPSPPLPRTFEAVVDMARDAKEAILHGHLLSDVSLVRFDPLSIELRLLPGAPADLPQRLSRFLGNATDRPWLVTVSSVETGAPTLYDQRRAEAETRLAEVTAHPLIARIMGVFPGATIEDIRTITPIEPGADAEPFDGDQD
jgi:DNA polymerase-3 subunit gamma/tau